MSVDISVSITEDKVDIIATPTVNIVNVTNSASIDPGLYDLSEFTNTSVNPFVRTSGLSSYVPTSRTLTINGTTQDLSADRTFTISTGITIGTTAITSGTVGRVLFEGAGNVVQESANLFWDNTNGRLGIGTSTPAFALDVVAPQYGGVRFTASDATFLRLDTTTTNFQISQSNTQTSLTTSNYGPLYFINNGGASTRLSLFANGNFAIGSTTDAGFRLDVNGTSRITGLAYQTGYSYSIQRLQFNQGVTTTNVGYISGISNGVIRLTNASETDFTRLQFGGGTTSYPSLQRSGSALSVMDATGTALTNLLVGTTTDAGFKLDVNGTARVQNGLTLTNFTNITSGNNYFGFETFRTIFGTTANTISGQYAFNIDDGGGSSTLTSGTTGRFQLSSRFAPTSGTAVYNSFLLNATINQTGGANGITRGLYINPTLTSAADFRAIETTAGRVIFGGLPTSSAGLPTGAIWNDAGTLKIV